MAIVVEDTEGFDARVLGDLLLALSDAADTLPVCVLLGVATSANMVHALLPAATAARLDARAFKLYAPKDVMAAVTARVLMDPARAPALQRRAGAVATRFKGDFSLSAAGGPCTCSPWSTSCQPLAPPRRGGGGGGGGGGGARRRDAHAQTTTDVRADHPLDFLPGGCRARRRARRHRGERGGPRADAAAVSALAARSARVAATAAAAAAAAAGRGGRLAHAQVRAVGEGHLGLGTKEEVGARCATRSRAQAVGAAVRCVAAGAAASGARKGELSALFVDASAAKWMTEKNASASQGESLLRLICARLERDDTDISVIRAACRRWARLVALEPAMHAEYGEDLRAAAALCDRAEAEARRGDFLQTNFLQTTESAPAAEAAARRTRARPEMVQWRRRRWRRRGGGLAGVRARADARVRRGDAHGTAAERARGEDAAAARNAHQPRRRGAVAGGLVARRRAGPSARARGAGGGGARQAAARRGPQQRRGLRFPRRNRG